MTLGVTIGKFYPFHLGHNYLIEQAKKQVDHLVVLVGYKPTQDQTVWVPEYGRWYFVGRQYTPHQELWDSYEFVKIAQQQITWEDNLAYRANKLIICDTDALATHLWHKRYLGYYSAEVEKIADSRDYDLYILTEPDFEFVQDGTRDGESIRLAMHQWFIEVLNQKAKNYICVSGSRPNRLDQATKSIDFLLKFRSFA